MISKYFGNTDEENIEEFKEKTPQGNIIEGFICKARNRYLGSMLITKICFSDGNIIDVEQFIQAMPRIEYYSDAHKMFVGENGITYPAYEKLDGTCLILYGLYYNNELIEIVPKTRGVPVADKKILSLFNELDHAHIISFFEQNKEMNPTLMFELYGTLNQHTIFYPETRISIRLIGATIESNFLNYFELGYLASQYDFELPKIFFILLSDGTGKWKLILKDGFLNYYLKNEIKLPISDLTQEEIVKSIKDVMNIVNDNYKEIHGTERLEGCVIHCYNHTGEQFKYMKIKPDNITIQAKKAGSQVPRGAIKKEIDKYFDEYGSKIKDIYNKNNEHFLEYINEGLLEDFSQTIVFDKKSQNKIRNMFLDKLQSQTGGKLNNICKIIVEENPGLTVSEYMKLFAEYYPERKSRSQKAFNIFKDLVDE